MSQYPSGPRRSPTGTERFARWWVCPPWTSCRACRRSTPMTSGRPYSSPTRTRAGAMSSSYRAHASDQISDPKGWQQLPLFPTCSGSSNALFRSCADGRYSCTLGKSNWPAANASGCDLEATSIYGTQGDPTGGQASGDMARPEHNPPRSSRRALLTPQVNTGSLYRCGKRT